MKFLKKHTNSKIITENLKYSNVSDRDTIREILLKEQKGFCAYSEEFFKNADGKQIEHFYPQNEYPQKKDEYSNIYLVKEHINQNRPKKLTTQTRTLLPILNPYSNEITNRIKYAKGRYKFEVEDDDIEAKNFRDFLNLNRPELVEDRKNHVQRVLKIKELASNETEFMQVLSKDKLYLSYITVLENELDQNFENLLN